jgi:predicted RNase H-like HicB family nuclease
MIILPIQIEPTETGGYLATSPVLPGFLVEGETIEEVYREAPVVAQALLEAYRQVSAPLPSELAQVSDHLSISILVPA